MSDVPHDEGERVHYGPDDPEYYLEKNNEDSDVTLSSVLGYALYRLVRGTVLGIAESPLNRVFLLQCVQSELVRDGRLPHGSFGSIRETVRYIIAKEGIRGLFRGAIANTIVSFPAHMAGRLAAFGVFMAQERLTPICRPLALLIGIAAPALRIVLSAPFVGYRDAMYCNYAADIVTTSATVPTEHPEASAKAHNRTEDVEETRRFATPWEAIAAVRMRRGWGEIFYNCMDVDIAAAYTMVLLMQVIDKRLTPSVMGFVFEHVQQPRRQMVALTGCLMGISAVYSFFTQPFYVIRMRMTLLPPAVDDERRKPKYRYRNLWQCAKEIVRRDGITSLWAGMRWRMIREMSALVLNVLFLRR